MLYFLGSILSIGCIAYGVWYGLTNHSPIAFTVVATNAFAWIVCLLDRIAKAIERQGR